MINLTDRMIYRLGNLNTEQQRISYQMSTGKLLDRGSDDSSVFARELYVDDKIRVYEGIQSQIAKTTAQNVVSDSSMGEIKTLLDNVKQEMIKSLNAGMDADDKQAAAVGVTGMKENLLTLANEKVNGEYLFAGGDTTVRPFSKDSTTGVVTYNGDALSRQIAVEPNTYRDRGISGIDMMFYTADEQTGSNALDYEEKERVIDSSGLEWIKPLATTGNKLTFDVGDATGGNTLTDNTADTWTLDTTTNTITNSGSTLTLDVVNLEGDMWQTVGTIDDGTTITSLRSTTDAIGLRQMGAYGVLSGNDLEVASSTGTPVTYTTANVDTSGGYATGTTIASKFFILRLWSDKYRASAITITHLAISEGCNPKGSPIFIHRYVPAIFSPKNGTVTAMIMQPYII